MHRYHSNNISHNEALFLPYRHPFHAIPACGRNHFLLLVERSPIMPSQLFRVFYPINQSNPVDQTDTMCIRNDRRFAKNISHDQVGTFLPTPGRLRIDLKSVGILPLYSSLKTFIHLLMSLALLFPRPQGRTISSISATSAAASASTVGYFSNNPFYYDIYSCIRTLSRQSYTN